MKNSISVVGCREHNLKNVTFEIPKGKLVVFTGVSGSGKTSAAMDTIHAEGQRRYVESLSAYARQFLGMLPKPDVDEIKGLCPSIAIAQKNLSNNPRSTVATVTEIYDYLRILFARVGRVYSPATNQPIKAYTVSEITNIIMSLGDGTKVMILCPIPFVNVSAKLEEIKKMGFSRIIIDGEILNLQEDADRINDIKNNLAVESDINHKGENLFCSRIAVVIDRFVLGKANSSMIADSVELAVQTSEGFVWVMNIFDKSVENYSVDYTSDKVSDCKGKICGKLQKFSTSYICPESGFRLDALDPTMFSFNSPKGACPVCNGLGELSIFDPSLIVKNPNLSIAEGAIEPTFKFSRDSYRQIFSKICSIFNTDINVPFNQLPEEAKKAIFFGTKNGKFSYSGVVDELSKWAVKGSDVVRYFLNSYRIIIPCTKCCGSRLKDEILLVKIDGLSISDVTKMSVTNSFRWINKISENMNDRDLAIAEKLIVEIKNRLHFLQEVGLDYVCLDRKSGTMSGGEMQRIVLASQLGSGLTGVLFVLDEPSIGLHPNDTDRLINVLLSLRDNGNSIIVIEHEKMIIQAADYFVDFGPGAGIEGGEIVFSGDYQHFKNAHNSLTSDYLFDRKQICEIKDTRSWEKSITLSGARTFNLKNLTVEFPLGVFICVTGVSGSGKSSLIMETLLPAMQKKPKQYPRIYDEIVGLDEISRVIEIDQSPIGRTPRSNPVTYVGGFTAIRELFASLPEAKARGYNVGRFSFNVKGGRCEACNGDGFIKVEMHFLADVFVECEYCKTKRYNKETLDIKYRQKTIADVLNMTISQAADFFKNVTSIYTKLSLLERVGLGYLKLGQGSNTLSGGEAQRIKLAKELSKRSDGRTFYILDEPTTGLHFEDVKKLLIVLEQLVEQKNTVLVIEHNTDIIKSADWIIDMGNSGGDEGGIITAAGTPNQLKENTDTSIYKYL